MEVKWQASAANVAGRGLSGVFGPERVQALGDGSPGRRELNQVLIEVLDLRQDEFGLWPMQFADKHGDDLGAAVRKHRERKYRRFKAERGGGVQGVLFADEQGIATLEAVGKIQHLVPIVDGNADHAHLTSGPFGVESLEQWYFATAGGAPGAPEVDHQGFAAERRDGRGLAGAVRERELRKTVRNLGGRQCTTQDSPRGRLRPIAGIGGAGFAGWHRDPGMVLGGTARRMEFCSSPDPKYHEQGGAGDAQGRRVHAAGRSSLRPLRSVNPASRKANPPPIMAPVTQGCEVEGTVEAACSGNSTLLMGG